MKALLLKLLDNLKYPSTWQGLLALATAGGLHLAPELQSQIVGAAVAVAGVIALLFSDADVKPK